MCGLVGFYPKKNKQVDLDKIFFLTIAIEERGTDSCGISIGDFVYKGSGKKSKSKDFIAEDLINTELPLDKPVIFHNRSATIKSSLTNEDDIHPFIWENKGSFMAGAHNGTLVDYKELKTEFCSFYHESLFNIDSHYLLLSIHANLDDIPKVLKSYKGAAALLFYTNNDYWVWKGANWGVEERPLYYIEDQNGWYFCSLPNPLKIAFKEDPIAVGDNTLMRFSNGKLQGEVVVDRKIVTQTGVVKSTWNYKTGEWDTIALPATYKTSQPFYYTDEIFLDYKKRRYVNTDFKVVSGPYKLSDKTLTFNAGQLVKCYKATGDLQNKMQFIKEHTPENVALELLPYVKNIIVDFYEVTIKKLSIFYFIDLDGEIQWVYDRKSKFIEDFTTSINKEDCRIYSFPKIKLYIYDYEASE